MLLEEFIITVFCWVDEGVEAVTSGIELRTPRFAPRLSDSEVITRRSSGRCWVMTATRRSGVISSGIGGVVFPDWGIGPPLYGRRPIFAD